jgi:hypothetical protein
MYLYDTRNEKDEISRFPIIGWFFPCLICGKIVGSKKKILIKKKFFNSKYLEVPCCKKCTINEKFIFDKENIHKIN